jgi:ribonuclease-3
LAPEPDSPVAALKALIDELPDELREQALTHSSWAERRVDSFERLAFLGDSVLGLAVATRVYETYPKLAAGGLTKVHNQAVSGVSCAEVGRELGVAEMLEETEPGGEDAIPAAVLLSGSRPLPEVTEALIGACFVAFGYERTCGAVAAAFEPRIQHSAETIVDFKSALQELLARRRARVDYEVISETGPAHRRVFDVAAVVNGKRVGRGTGRSKKAAEQVAAERALERLDG